MALGIASIPLALFWGIGVLLAIAGMILSIIALSKYKQEPGLYSTTSRGYAKVGLICSIIGLSFVIIFFIVIFMIFAGLSQMH